MAFKPGHKKFGGRKKGSITKDRQMLLDKAKELGVDPFEVLLRFAAADWKGLGYEREGQTVYTAGGGQLYEHTISPELRQKSANDASQYMLPKLKAIEVDDKGGKTPLIVVYQSEWGSKVEAAGDGDSDTDT